MRDKSRVELLAVGFFLVWSISLRAEDWTTTNGKTYKGVMVVKHDDASVTILDDDGGARVLLSDLSPDLQKKFGYDPAKAAAADQKYQDEQKLAVQQFSQQVQAQSDAQTASAAAAEQEKAAQKEQKEQFDKENGVRPSDIEALCALVHLDEQASAAQVTTAVSSGGQWTATSASVSDAAAVDNHGNAAAAVGQTVNYTATEDPAIEKRRRQRGLPELWTPGIGEASKLLERPCTPEQQSWLNAFIDCAKLAGGTDASYGSILQGLTVRPPPPPWSASNP